MLTVFRDNAPAMDFYRRKLKYDVDATSPSACGEEAPHEILSKCVNAAAAAEAEERFDAAGDSDD